MDFLNLRQTELIESIERIRVNFNKDSASRKTPEYIKQRLTTLEEVWEEFETNHVRLAAYGRDEHDYFKNDTYSRGISKYAIAKETIMKYQTAEEKGAEREEKATASQRSVAQVIVGEEKDAERENRRSVRQDRGTEPCGKVDEMMTRQRTNFRAFKRAINGIDIDEITEKWEYEDELSNIQRLWNNIQSLHLDIDNILQGGDISYEDEFFLHERQFKSMKRLLNKKISSSLHTQHSTPVLDIPCFTGKYSQWPTFCGLFTEGIHNNNSISDTQKLQHLKGKVKGEPERLIQHLAITAENYEAAWGILVRRYNNRQQLFTTQIEILLDQPAVQRQSAFEIKRLHDTSVECIHAIHNLDIDTNTWDPLLVHLIAKKLDPLTLKEYRQARQSPRELAEISEFITFLESKFTALEPMFKKERDNQAINSPTPRQFYQNPKPRTFPQSRNYYNYNRNNYQNKTYHTQAARCPICNWNHNLFQCKKFLAMSPDAMLKVLSSANICKNCLYKHYEKPCTSTKRCKECNLDHNSLLHGAFSKSTTSIPNKPALEFSSKQPINNEHIKSHKVNHVAGHDEEILLTTVLLNVISQDGTPITLRALLDQGSQISLISENAVQVLGLQRQQYHASVSGIGNGFKESKGIVNIECHSIYNDYKFTTQALVISRVINNLPNISFKRQVWPHLQGLKLADPEYNLSRPIDLLLDASVYSEIIMSGLIKGPLKSPIAQQTKLGYILSGNIKTFNCHVVINNLSELSKYWEIEEVSSSSKDLSEGDMYCEEFYQATKNRLPNGMYEVGLPMKPNFEEKLGSSKSKATAQFYQLERKMKNSKEFAESYRNFMEDYEKLGHMELTKGTFGATCYLPHHGVLKLDSTTTRLRVVYNGSSKTCTGYSLNDLMEQGPNLQADLLSLIISWRQYQYVMTADIEKMFRCIFITKPYQHLQSIIWRPTPEKPLNTYLTTVTYGTKAAPYLAMRTLKQIAKDDADKFPLGAKALTTKFYMDDYYGGNNSLEEAKETQSQLVNILDGAGMNLRKWSSNEESLISHLPDKQLNTPYEFKCSETRKTLGLKWIPSTDSFCYENKLDISLNKYTKRELLSNISRIYDPIGWISPLSIKAKLLFQETWNLKISWDEKLPYEVIEKWLAIREDFENINQIIIPRHVGNTKHAYEVHAFCDASEKSFACAVYCVTMDDKGEYISRLLVAKTKVAPLNKKITLPRLELCGAVLLAQLTNKVITCLSSQQNIKVTAWSDSMIVLGWIRGDEARWLQFVANRVKQIKTVVPAENWNYIKSEENPADFATRGVTLSQLSKHRLWWEGPLWLPKFKRENLPKITYEEPDIDVKKSCMNTALCHTHSTVVLELLDKCSSITFIIKTIGWALRFIKIAKHGRKQNDPLMNVLSSTEFRQAFNLIIKTVQEYEYQEDFDNLRKLGHVHKNSKLSSLNPFIDGDDGLLKVGGRLRNSYIKWTAKHPIILSSHSRLTELIINQAHIATLHGGAKLTLSHIRDKFWIVSGVRTVKRQLRKCVKCRRFSQEKYQPIMADLPAPRVNPSRPFTFCGIDFTGNFDVKTNKGRGVRTTKGYVAVFVCLATKSVHLELVSDLSTPAFLAAFRRFCSRRGVPAHIYSDNGTNFVGANKLLKKETKEIMNSIDKELVLTNIGELDIKWHFNAPAYPSAGGLWEAAVKSLKHHLKRVIGDQKLTYEEFTTVLHQVEACLNSRPLCTVTENHEEEILTPGHFLIGGSLLSRPQTEPESFTLSKRWQLLQAINKQFWKSWSKEYLQQLQVRSKWRTSKRDVVKLNDIVLIKEDNLPPGKWSMGKITELHPGNDGQVRVVSIKTKATTIKRPVIKLVPLLPYETDQTNISTNTKDRARQQRVIKPKTSTFKTFLLTLFMFLSFLISPTIPHQQGYNITSFNDNRSLYFDKMADLHVVRDDWKLIIYYDMSTYWQSLHDIQQYVTHIKESGASAANIHYESVTLQLEHEFKEIVQYNELLVSGNKNRRSKRGLVNGIGYIASSLFGVLDERFAEQYQRQIEITRRNENLLQHLLHNQTIIIESEFNIIKRHEEVMKKQFTFIKNHLENLNVEVNNLRVDTTNKLYITSSSLSAHLILSNIRRMQQILIDTVTDIHQGNVNMHLISPEQLKAQLNIISSYLQGDLSLPVEGSDYVHLYKLLRVAARVTDKYLIIEVRIPLISNDKFELDKIISIPQVGESHYYRIVPTFPYIGFNINKDSVLFLSEVDLQLCRHMSSEILLCTLNSPIYSTNIKQSVCDIKIMSAGTKVSQCSSEVSNCKESWVKLHADNVWLFICCAECHVRIICLSDVTSQILRNSGIIELGSACTIKGEDFTIHTHNNYFNSINIKPQIKVPQSSVLNKLNLTPSVINISESDNEDESIWSSLRMQISQLKAESNSELSVHDVHHYSLGYVVVGILLSTLVVVLYRRVRKRGALALPFSGTTTVEARDAVPGRTPQVPPAPTPRAAAGDVLVHVSSDQMHKSDMCVSRGTSPTRFVKFDVE